MNDTYIKNLKDAVQETLERFVETAFYCEADTDACYPYVVYELKRLTSRGTMANYRLSIDVWDKNITYSRVDDIAGRLEKELDGLRFVNEYLSFVIYTEDDDHIPDSDRQIKRMRANFTLQVVFR